MDRRKQVWYDIYVGRLLRKPPGFVWWVRWIDLHFRFAKIDVLPPSSWRQATVHRTVAFGSVSKLTNEGKPADLQSAAIAARRLTRI